jgi:hypothetical protein
MGEVIMRDGQLTAETDDIFEDVAADTGLAPDVVKAMALEMRTEINAAGGINCPDEVADQIWAAIQRRHGVPEHRIEPPHMRMQ